MGESAGKGQKIDQPPDLVFESLVQSSLLTIFGRTKTETGPPLSEIVKRLDQTITDWSFAVLRPVLVLTGLLQNILKIVTQYIYRNLFYI